jgi:hypothetical protein
VFSVTVFTALLGIGFQWPSFPFPSVPELSLASATSFSLLTVYLQTISLSLSLSLSLSQLTDLVLLAFASSHFWFQSPLDEVGLSLMNMLGLQVYVSNK